MLTRKPTRRTQRSTGPSPDVIDCVLDRACYCCEVCGSPCADQRGTDWSMHHRRPRGMGGSRWSGINLPSNLLLVCGSGTTLCHGAIENYRAGAVAAGWLVMSNTDPANVAALITRDRWCYLTNDGRYSDHPRVGVAGPLPCMRCFGAREVNRSGLVAPCPDCCCPVCGTPTGGGMCAEHEAQDFLAADREFERRADR